MAAISRASAARSTCVVGMICAILAQAWATSASAQDWSGYYFGVNAGSAQTRYGISGNGNAFDNLAGGGFGLVPVPTAYRVDLDGAQVGAHVGYNYQAAGLVVGLTGEYSFLTGRYNKSGIGPFEEDYLNVKIRSLAVLSGRVGMPYGNFLPYLKAGLAGAHVSMRAGDLDVGAIDRSDATHSNGLRLGYVYGLGGEYKISSQWSARLEYQVVALKSFQTSNEDRETYHHSGMEIRSVNVGVSRKF